jgi:hypothetical protein
MRIKFIFLPVMSPITDISHVIITNLSQKKESFTRSVPFNLVKHLSYSVILNIVFVIA